MGMRHSWQVSEQQAKEDVTSCTLLARMGVQRSHSLKKIPPLQTQTTMYPLKKTRRIICCDNSVRGPNERSRCLVGDKSRIRAHQSCVQAIISNQIIKSTGDGQVGRTAVAWSAAGVRRQINQIQTGGVVSPANSVSNQIPGPIKSDSLPHQSTYEALRLIDGPIQRARQLGISRSPRRKVRQRPSEINIIIF